MTPASVSIPRRLPVVLEDRILYWMQGSHCSVFNMVIHCKGRLDFPRLKRAMRLCLDAEPVLGCRFVNRPDAQFWERLDDLDSQECAVLVPEEVHGGDPAAFLDALPLMDVHRGPQLRAHLLRGDDDILCIGLNHVAGDGGGLKDASYQLARIYNRLGNDPEYSPNPNLGARGFSQVSKHLGWGDWARIFRRGFRDMAGFAKGRTHREHPLVIRKPEGFTMFLRTIGPENFLGFKQYGKARGATVNDIMASAMLRAFYSVVNPDSRAWLRVVTTADLRRYIPDEQAAAVCNLSGFSYVNIGQGLPTEFDDLLKVVSREFAALKKDYIGLGSIPLTAMVFKTLPFSWGLWIHDRLGNLQKRQTATTGDAALLFTNSGRIDPEKLAFEDARVSCASVTTTRATPPVLSVCISGFGDKLSITAGFCQNTLSRNKATTLLDRMEQELGRLAQAGRRQDA